MLRFDGVPVKGILEVYIIDKSGGKAQDLQGKSMNELDQELFELSKAVGQALLHSEMQLATAESCTGGAIAAAITDVAGSSAWFGAGFVTYSNEMKQQMLGIRASTLEEHGAVSEAVVEEMADGALLNSVSHISVAVSGVAGPDGGSDDKPVGTVWIAWAVRGRQTCSELFAFTGDRQCVRRSTVIAALRGVQRRLRN